MSRELAEKDSLRLVIQGQDKKAQDLYSDFSNVNKKKGNDAAYNSSRAIPINPYGRSSSNSHVLAREANKKKLIEDAKVIQGPRPTL